MLLSQTRTLTGVLLGVAGLGVGTYLLLVGDRSGWSLVGVGALCLTTALVLRTVGRRVERSGGLRRRASPRTQRVAQVVAGLVLLGIAVAVLTAGDLSDPTARGLPRWLFGGLNLVLGVAFLGWAAFRPRVRVLPDRRPSQEVRGHDGAAAPRAVSRKAGDDQ